MAQQTAVSHLINKLRELGHNPKTHLGMGDVRITQGYIDELEEQALQMEKKQIIDAYGAGQYDGHYVGYGKGIGASNKEKYYNKTFKPE